MVPATVAAIPSLPLPPVDPCVRPAMPPSPRAVHPFHVMSAGHATGQKQGRDYRDRRLDWRRLRICYSRPSGGAAKAVLSPSSPRPKGPQVSFSPWRARISRGLRACCVISTLAGRCPDRRPGLSVLRCCSARGLDADQHGNLLFSLNWKGSSTYAEQHVAARHLTHAATLRLVRPVRDQYRPSLIPYAPGRQSGQAPTAV